MGKKKERETRDRKKRERERKKNRNKTTGRCTAVVSAATAAAVTAAATTADAATAATVARHSVYRRLSKVCLFGFFFTCGLERPPPITLRRRVFFKPLLVAVDVTKVSTPTGLLQPLNTSRFTRANYRYYLQFSTTIVFFFTSRYYDTRVPFFLRSL